VKGVFVKNNELLSLFYALGRDPMSIIIVLDDFVLESLRIVSIVDVLPAYPVDRNASQVQD
jgi:hypothetical protein